LKNYARILGYTGLIIGVILYITLAYMLVENRDIYDDNVTWFHKYIVEYVKNAGDLSNARGLSFIDGRNLLASPILIDYIIAYLNIPLNYWTLLTGIIYIIVVFALTYVLTRDLVVSGVASMLLSVTPCFIYWFKYNVFGAYTFQPLTITAIILLGMGLTSGGRNKITVGVVLAILSWFIDSNGWLIPLTISVYLAILMYKNVIDVKYIYPSIAILSLTLPINIISRYTYITRYHVYAYASLLLVLILYLVLYRVKKTLGGVPRYAFAFIGSLSMYLIGLYITAYIDASIRIPGVLENYAKAFNPVMDLGVNGLFTLLALIMIIRSKMITSVENRFTELSLITVFVTGIVLAYYNQVLSVISIASMLPFISLALVSISTALIKSGRGYYRYVYGFIALWIIIGGLIASAIPSYTLSTSSPRIYYLDLPRELMLKREINSSALLHVLESIRFDNRSKLVIAYWGYSYWIVGYLGPNTYTLADPTGSINGWRIISWIFLSDEDTALGVIKGIVGNRTDIDVYVLVSEVVSIENVENPGGGRIIADIGHVLIMPPATPGGAARTSFMAVGDLGRILTYLAYSNYNASQYINPARAKYDHELPLAWSFKTPESLVVSLVVNGLNKLGYDAMNSIYMEMPLRIKGLKYFELVNSTLTQLYDVKQDIYNYTVYSFIALYKVNLYVNETMRG